VARLPEQRSWDTFSKSIDGSRLKFKRVENLCDDGMPDVVCLNKFACQFWIENKAIEDWPARFSTPVLSSAFERGQLGWGRAWNWFGGNSFVLLRIIAETTRGGLVGRPRNDDPGLSYYLLDPCLKLDELNRTELVSTAIMTGKKEIQEYLYNLKNKAL
jgi:hypothetical protein